MTKDLLSLESERFFSFLYLIFSTIGISFRGGRKRGKRSFVRAPRKQHRTNNEINKPQVRLVDSDGAPLGIVDTSKAIEMAREREIDLVEISPKADPPVCKLIEYGKMLYALKKKEQKNKQATKAHEQKGIRLTFRMGEGDQDRQRQKAEEFLTNGHPLRIQLVMRGREKAHKDIAFEKLNAFVKSLAEISKLENIPRSSGHQIIAILKPSK